ncbi:MAG TPA: holo-[acyl-carrier-protein] synthase [Desulfotomaculum sp.]|nr:holo-[acyl-carrier-protein] synthase [Desulfotomaculum sp.]
MVRGVGTDIIEINRLRRSATRFSGRFLKRIFTPGELAYCSQQRDPFPCYAVRFAAKEAVLKAMGTGLAQGCNWQDVEVVAQSGKAPEISLHGKVAAIAREKGICKALISLSHDQTRAVAFALVLGG